MSIAQSITSQSVPAVRPAKRTTIQIQRAPHDDQHTFVQINLAVVRELPVDALGMLAKLLAFADGWDIDEDRLERDYNVTPGVIRSTHKDLRERGHLSKSHSRGKGNRIAGSVWKVTEAPKIHAAEIRSVENHSAESRDVESRSEENHSVEFLPDGSSAVVEGARASLYPLSQNLVVPEKLEDTEPQSLNAGAHEDKGESEISFAPPLHRYLEDFVSKLGHPNGHAVLLEAEIERLGDAEARAVLLGCDNAGSWQYILKALKQRSTPATPSPRSAPPPSVADDPFMTVPATFPPLGGIWLTACQAIELESVRYALTFGAVITEPDIQQLRIESAAYEGDLLQQPGVQAAVDMMSEFGIRIELVQRAPEDVAPMTRLADLLPVITEQPAGPNAADTWARICRQLPQLYRITNQTAALSLDGNTLRVEVHGDRVHKALDSANRHLIDFAAREVLGDGVEVRFELADEKAGAA